MALTAILGAGVMGETLLSGLIRAGRRVDDLLVGEKRRERADELTERYGVTVVGNVEAAQKAAPRSATVLLDPGRKAVAAFGLTSLPAVFVVDRGGVVRAVHLGTPEGLEATLRGQIEALREGKPIAR